MIPVKKKYPTTRDRHRIGRFRQSSTVGIVIVAVMVCAHAVALSQAKQSGSDLKVATTALSSTTWLPTALQVTSLMPFTHQGDRVSINGRELSARWNLRSQRVGISDAGLMQGFGIHLTDTESPDNQPIQWFPQSGQSPIAMATWLDQQSRYLDITELAQNYGWQVQSRNHVLYIETPTSRILGIRRGRQSWGDRIVIDLDRPAPWRVIERSGEFTVILDAAVDARQAQSVSSGTGNLIRSISVESSPNQARLTVNIPANMRPHVWSLGTPNRLIIDVGSEAVVRRNILWTPGLRWKQQIVRVGNADFPTVMLEVNPRQPGLTLKPIWSNPATAVGTAPLLTTAQRWQTIAAVNGGFFNRNNQLPLGAIRQEGRWISGPILNRGAIAWNDAGEIYINRLSLQEAIQTPTGQSFPVLHLNSGYVQAGIARYTPDWGTSYTTLIDQEIVLTVQNGQVVRQQVGAAAGQTTVQIPGDGYLLALRSFRTAANAMPIGTLLQIDTRISPMNFTEYPHVIGGGPLLLQNRQIVLNPQLEQFTDAFIRERAPRSAIGINNRGNILIVIVQSRINGPGPSLVEIAQIMQQLETVHALNLDGGSSTTLYLGGQLLNRSSTTAARVHNGIGIFVQPNF
jgi:hypothetical protein